jgi:hypothetical protein
MGLLKYDLTLKKNRIAKGSMMLTSWRKFVIRTWCDQHTIGRGCATIIAGGYDHGSSRREIFSCVAYRMPREGTSYL